MPNPQALREQVISLYKGLSLNTPFPLSIGLFEIQSFCILAETIR